MIDQMLEIVAMAIREHTGAPTDLDRAKARAAVFALRRAGYLPEHGNRTMVPVSENQS